MCPKVMALCMWSFKQHVSTDTDYISCLLAIFRLLPGYSCCKGVSGIMSSKRWMLTLCFFCSGKKYHPSVRVIFTLISALTIFFHPSFWHRWIYGNKWKSKMWVCNICVLYFDGTSRECEREHYTTRNYNNFDILKYYNSLF